MSPGRILISGTGSGVGKTLVGTAIMAELSKRMRVQPFKVGPDFIDPMYHRLVTGRHSRNLDGFMMPHASILDHFQRVSEDADISIVEGVRGLFEGLDWDTEVGSTAEMAKILKAPVILMVNARSLTRSAAALVNGFKSFDPEVNLAGVLLNNVSGPQHKRKAVQAIENFTGTEVLGVISKDASYNLPSRHLGLNTVMDRGDIGGFLELTEKMLDDVDLDRIMEIASDAPPLSLLDRHENPEQTGSGLRAAIPLDHSYCFYYPENIESLSERGVKIIHYRPTDGDPLPEADIHYLGGGYPELHAQELSSNDDFLQGLRNASADGKLVIGECGGLMTLCDNIVDIHGQMHEMVGIFAADAVMTPRRQGLSYVQASVNTNNPIFPVGGLRSHEFHYSSVSLKKEARFCYDVQRGTGIVRGKDGITVARTIGTYMHQHAISYPGWGDGLIAAVLDTNKSF